MSFMKFRILIQLQDPDTLQYIGAPRPLLCRKCKRSWFSHPCLIGDTLAVECTNCDTLVELDEILTRQGVKISVFSNRKEYECQKSELN